MPSSISYSSKRQVLQDGLAGTSKTRSLKRTSSGSLTGPSTKVLSPTKLQSNPSTEQERKQLRDAMQHYIAQQSHVKASVQSSHTSKPLDTSPTNHPPLVPSDHVIASSTPKLSALAIFEIDQEVDEVKKTVTRLFLTALQRQLFMAQQSLTEFDYQLVRQYHKSCKTQPIASPPVDVNRKGGILMSVNWNRLIYVFSKLTVRSLKHHDIRPLNTKAIKAVHWLKHIVNNPTANRYLIIRDVLQAKYFNMLCAEAIISQNVILTDAFQEGMTSLNYMETLNQTDSQEVLKNPKLLETDYIIGWIGVERFSW